ncbi:hypothetical protein [Thermomonas alba]|uniref:hypothetical protein n=1 Tax=Thermomonas alba TaxID=2888525 RepID=UPI001F04A7ED|nr:hypothetical protein [Thermomonas alba]
MSRAAAIGAGLCLALLAGVAVATGTGDDAPADPIAAYFARMREMRTPFAEFRFMTGSEVAANPTWKQIAGQTLAASLATLGRPNDAIRSFPLHDRRAAPDDLPTPATHAAQPAVDWIVDRAADLRVIMVNEAHHRPETRQLTLALLAPLRARGFTHLAVEALADPPLPKGYPTLDTGYYTREPVFAEMLREARRQGYVLVPYEPASKPGLTQQQRETGMATTLAGLLRAHPKAKVLIHAGYGHISKRAGSQPGNADPMALEFMRLSGLPILAVDQTRLTWEDGAAADRLARTFDVQAPAVLEDRHTHRVWSASPDGYDASIVLPASDTSSVRPSWLTLDARRQPVTIDLTPCKTHLPCLAEARYASEGDDAIPADQFVLLADGETDTPLYLAPGQYRLRLTGPDDTVLADRTLDVPAHDPSPSDTP